MEVSHAPWKKVTIGGELQDEFECLPHTVFY